MWGQVLEGPERTVEKFGFDVNNGSEHKDIRGYMNKIFVRSIIWKQETISCNGCFIDDNKAAFLCVSELAGITTFPF